MAHEHGRTHLARRQRHHKQDDNNDDGVKVVIATRIVTLDNTWGPNVPVAWKTLGNDNDNPKTKSGDPIPKTAAPKTTKAGGATKISAATRASESSTEETSAPSKPPSSLVVASSSPVPSLGGAAAGIASASIALSSAAPTSDAQAKGGMSTGAKAGMILAILVAVGALLGAVLFVYHRKKKRMAASTVDDEKASMHSAPPPPRAQINPTAPSIKSERAISTAPRLSLRPVTQFSPTFSDKNGGSLHNAAAVGAAAQPHDDRASPRSPWERPGAASAASNPFDDPPQNPFVDSAVPVTPQSATYPSASPSDFANPAPAIAAAATATAAAAAAVASASKAREEVAPPPSIKETVPPSPAWTDDIPASPGPAPSGPLPVAMNGAKNNGPVPAPAPAPVPSNVYRVQMAFKPSMHDELELTEGQLIRMLHEYDDGWALCVRMDRSQQGVVPRTCLSKHAVKPRNGPPRQGPPAPRRGPPIAPPTGPGTPRPLTPSSGQNTPAPPYPVNESGPHPVNPASLQMSPPSIVPQEARARSNSSAPYSGPPRSMSPGPYGGGPQQLPPPQMARPRSNSASEVHARRGPTPGFSPMNPNHNMPMPSRKPLPGQAL